MINVLEHIKALIFDCDGTLVDSIPLHFEAWEETFIAQRRSYPHEFIEEHEGMPVIEIIRQYNKVYNDDLDPKQFAVEKEMRVKEKLLHVKPIIPVAQVVTRYKGILPMAVCSGSHRECVKISIHGIGFENIFKFIITADDDLRPKPSPDMFLEAARRLEVEPGECQVFEDSDLGIEAATNAGMVVTDIRQYFD
jgi:HAD superfamily hydrolase (TIGR01509 family)